jgi:hypothetical protein
MLFPIFLYLEENAASKETQAGSRHMRRKRKLEVVCGITIAAIREASQRVHEDSEQTWVIRK